MPSKWELLRTIEAIRTPLGLRGTSVALLRALLSYLPRDYVDTDRDDGHICFASNTALAQRAYVSVQTIERHIKKLVELGLIARRSSGNGKRWARRNRQGQVTLATGISLAPLLRRHPEFLDMEEAHLHMMQQAGELRGKCQIVMAQLGDTAPEIVSQAQRLLRRSLTLDALRQLLAWIMENTSGNDSEETVKMRGIASESEGHKEPKLESVEKLSSSEKIEVSTDQMERAYPSLCNELRTARSYSDCERILEGIAQQLALGTTWFELRDVGPTKSFMILGYVLEKITTIKTPRAYIKQLLRRTKEQNFDWYALLTPSSTRRQNPIGA